MRIFIDESGPFTVPSDRRKPAISCAGALIVPEGRHDELATAFLALSQSWPKDNGEVKGRLLGEAEIDAAIKVFAEHGALFDCVAIDLGLHRVQEINNHKTGQATKVLAAVTPKHQPTLIAEINELARQIRNITVPEYLQTVVLIELIDAVLATKIMFFAQTAPFEIGTFWWLIDAKGPARTRSEKIWGKLLLPLLQSRSLRNPGVQLIGADYSAFARFEVDEPPEHMRPHLRNWGPGDGLIDIRLLMTEHQGFADSRNSVGLQMADVVTNAAARALKGNLGPAGWQRLGSIMLQQTRQHEIIRLVQLHTRDRRWKPSPPYYRVLRHLRQTAMPLLMPENKESELHEPTASVDAAIGRRPRD